MVFEEWLVHEMFPSFPAHTDLKIPAVFLATTTQLNI